MSGDDGNFSGGGAATAVGRMEWLPRMTANRLVAEGLACPEDEASVLLDRAIQDGVVRVSEEHGETRYTPKDTPLWVIHPSIVIPAVHRADLNTWLASEKAFLAKGQQPEEQLKANTATPEPRLVKKLPPAAWTRAMGRAAGWLAARGGKATKQADLEEVLKARAHDAGHELSDATARRIASSMLDGFREETD